MDKSLDYERTLKMYKSRYKHYCVSILQCGSCSSHAKFFFYGGDVTEVHGYRGEVIKLLPSKTMYLYSVLNVPIQCASEKFSIFNYIGTGSGYNLLIFF